MKSIMNTPTEDRVEAFRRLGRELTQSSQNTEVSNSGANNNQP